MDLDIDIVLDQPPAELDQPALWFLFSGHRVLLAEDPDLPPVPEHYSVEALGVEPQRTHYLGRLRGQPCFAVAVPEEAPPAGFYAEDLRRLIGRLDDSMFHMASRASQVIRWAVNHRFCSRCGTATEPHASDRAMVCPQCGYTQYPRITPCVIMLVTAGDRALLARSSRFPDGFYSCLAGFMEPGETPEQAVRREVMEETSVSIRDLRYYGSQSWPFPHSLMLGFRAEYAGGDIVVDDEEIVDARWWRPHELPRVPPRGSIARALIDDWLAGMEEGISG